ncbi:hypothetical protein [Deminuibacter soli]|uniref:Anti-sigma factor n=1 Tax=Deminuibacter soli TaxID=2291815 RepID=A0A3E1NQ83_9BACT|nr:hypothetical protein [Deminuibacter soli]RFM29974.1 hypothetical protein DXN05_03090 [Deminuibacter soli]
MHAEFDIDEYLASGVAARYAQNLLTQEELMLFEQRFSQYPELRNALLAEQLSLLQRKMNSSVIPAAAIWQQVEQAMSHSANPVHPLSPAATTIPVSDRDEAGRKFNRQLLWFILITLALTVVIALLYFFVLV